MSGIEISWFLRIGFGELNGFVDYLFDVDFCFYFSIVVVVLGYDLFLIRYVLRLLIEFSLVVV